MTAIVRLPAYGALAAVGYTGILRLFDSMRRGDSRARMVMNALADPQVRDALLNGSDPYVTLPPESAEYQGTVDLILRMLHQGTDHQRDEFLKDPTSFPRVFSVDDMRRASGETILGGQEGSKPLDEAVADESDEPGLGDTLRQAAQDAVEGTQAGLAEAAVWVAAAFVAWRWIDKTLR